MLSNHVEPVTKTLALQKASARTRRAWGVLESEAPACTSQPTGWMLLDLELYMSTNTSATSPPSPISVHWQHDPIWMPMLYASGLLSLIVQRFPPRTVMKGQPVVLAWLVPSPTLPLT